MANWRVSSEFSNLVRFDVFSSFIALNPRSASAELTLWQRKKSIRANKFSKCTSTTTHSATCYHDSGGNFRVARLFHVLIFSFRDCHSDGMAFTSTFWHSSCFRMDASPSNATNSLSSLSVHWIWPSRDLKNSTSIHFLVSSNDSDSSNIAGVLQHRFVSCVIIDFTKLLLFSCETSPSPIW